MAELVSAEEGGGLSSSSWWWWVGSESVVAVPVDVLGCRTGVLGAVDQGSSAGFGESNV